MNKTDVNGHGNPEPPPQPGYQPECGTPTTPPCPLQELYVVRTKTIKQLAGPGADRRRIEAVAHQVDRYLIASLQSVSVLVAATQGHAGPPHEHGGEPHAPQPAPK
jgi:hypothetical protein